MQNASSWINSFNKEDEDEDEETSIQPMTSSVVSIQTVSSYTSKESEYDSKRSTEEEELRSMSTTPRYSHEDLGRIVSPPHSSESTSSPGEIYDDTLSTAQVLLKSRTTDHNNIDTVKNTNSSYKVSKTDSNYKAEPNNSSTTVKRQDYKKPYYSDLDFRATFNKNSEFRQVKPTELMDRKFPPVDDHLGDIMIDADTVGRDMLNEQENRRILERQLQQIDVERKDLNTKLATLRVKLGVANSNYNVSKNECDKLRKTFQETEIKKARLEERIQSCSKELKRQKDPNNPESNVSMKKIVLIDRKTIRQLRSDLEGVKSERSEMQKQIQDRDEKIEQLKSAIEQARGKLANCSKEYEMAKESATTEKKKREEVEVKYNELMKEKNDFDSKMADIFKQFEQAADESAVILQKMEKYRETEATITSKLSSVEKKLKDTLTEIEQQKNRNMPIRTASSIKFHQYRLSRSSLVPDTTPHVIVAVNPNASIAASGFLGKTVVSKKPTASLPGGKNSKATTPRSKGSSLPAKR